MPSSELKPGDLAKLASDVLIGNGVPCPWYLAGKIADAAFARWPHIAGPHTITTREEARQLPNGTVLMHQAGPNVTAYVIDDAAEESVRHTDNDYWNGGFECIEFPALVLWVPEVAA